MITIIASSLRINKNNVDLLALGLDYCIVSLTSWRSEFFFGIPWSRPMNLVPLPRKGVFCEISSIHCSFIDRSSTTFSLLTAKYKLHPEKRPNRIAPHAAYRVETLTKWPIISIIINSKCFAAYASAMQFKMNRRVQIQSDSAHNRCRRNSAIDATVRYRHFFAPAFNVRLPLRNKTF